MARLQDKIAIVTGGAQGLGAGAVRALAAAGAQVVIADANADTGNGTAAEYNATFMQLDVRDEDQWEALMTEVLSRHGRLDVLVNNAGIFSNCPVDETPLADFQRVIDINLTGCFLGCKHGVRAMKQNPDGAGGSIINLSSITGLRGQVGGAAYCSSKGGVRLLTKTVAVENGKRGIRCNSIHPGVMHTPMLQGLLDAAGDAAPAVRQQIEGNTPLARLGDAGDIGDMVVFLASDESRFVTGAELVVDGGMTVGLPD